MTQEEITQEEWDDIYGKVADEMIKHTKPFVTPLRTKTMQSVPRLAGTGSYVSDKTQQILLTCEHVAKEKPMHYSFHGTDNVYKYNGHWTMEKCPVDAAFAIMSDKAWTTCCHQAQLIPFNRFAQKHNPTHRELLFFYGFAGENSSYGFNVHKVAGTGYVTQEKENSGNAHSFELLWKPEKISLSKNATQEAVKNMRFENPGDFSGSLVWNTRYFEQTNCGHSWKPEDAVVTGLLQRWDQTLLAWRVENLRSWLLNEIGSLVKNKA